MLDVFFEAQFKHLISFVKHNSFYTAEVNVSAFNVIDDTTSGTNEELDTSVKFTSLVFDGNTAINCDAGVLVWVVL